ncbi:MAG: DUF1684 domain-containing protein [Chloroflexota bacterium]
MSCSPSSPYLELLDWRRQLSELFASLRHRPRDAETLTWFRAEKDRLFRAHPQSPIPSIDQQRFVGLAYWPYDPAAQVEAHFTPSDEGPPAAASEVPFRRIGHLDFELRHTPLRLGAFWIEGYAGGLFVPFTDSTSGHATYAGGRYLLDTIKGADLGSGAEPDRVSLDFNYAYHPSCTYDPRWVCPLAPPDSRLAIAIPAGERL